ncbi:UNKNOWN [Stylonychia lemnae]|uniref:Uncharacterized protein n=1 Tax=Stylonychia lemnae TaxID=5949 RepID=A0A078AF86_STYLE|nr:UNKNOWN [Stylonychia lemnae]|eukprot:CDW79578.1 UNKNOWN [Stylonychia lemnae]
MICGYESQYQNLRNIEYMMHLHLGCGNIEVQTHYLKPSITFQQHKEKLKNIKILDSIEAQPPFYQEFYDQNGASLNVNQILDIPLCDTKMIVEICLLDEYNALESLNFTLDFEDEVCYVTEKMQLSETLKYDAVQCALSDFHQCHLNSINSCKFIDCLTTLDTDTGEMSSSYLFSTCIPIQFTSRLIQSICKDVASGNDFVDYSQNFISQEMKSWKFNHMHYFLIAIVVVIIILVLVCTLSCYYHYQILRTHKVPFKMPKCCPECLFPHTHYKRMIDHESLLGQELESQAEKSDMISVSFSHIGGKEEGDKENESHYSDREQVFVDEINKINEEVEVINQNQNLHKTGKISSQKDMIKGQLGENMKKEFNVKKKRSKANMDMHL